MHAIFTLCLASAVVGLPYLRLTAGQSASPEVPPGASAPNSTALPFHPAIAYSTWLGGPDSDEGAAIAVDPAGNAYVAGNSGGGLPYTTRLSADGDIFVAKFSPDGSRLLYATLIGYGHPQGIAVDRNGNACVIGFTQNTGFPTTNAVQSVHGGGASDVFVLKLDANGGLVFSTYLGGLGEEQGTSIAIGDTGDVFVAGFTRSADFPTKNPFQSTLAGSANGFVARLASMGSELVFSTFLGGTGFDSVKGLVLDHAGNVCVAGRTTSEDFPLRNPFQAVLKGGADAFVTKLKGDGSALLSSTYIGGDDTDDAEAVAVDGDGSLVLAGTTRSGNFPVANALQTQLHGDSDVFVAKLGPTGSTLAFSTYIGGNLDEGRVGISANSNFLYLAGSTDSSDFPVTTNAFKAISSDWNDEIFVAKIDINSGTLAYATFLGGGGSESPAGIALDPAGNAWITGTSVHARFPPYFPITPGAFQPMFGGFYDDAFLAKITETTEGPANDLFSGRALLSGKLCSVMTDNSAATSEIGEPTHVGDAASHSLWWTWTAPASGYLILSTAGSAQATTPALYTGDSLPALTRIPKASESPDGVNGVRIRFPVESGTLYQIAVDTRDGGTGLLFLTLAFSGPPNDEFVHANRLSGLPASANGSNVDSTTEPEEPYHGLNIGSKSVWWDWTADSNGPVTATAKGEGFPALMAIYSGTALASLRPVAFYDWGRDPTYRLTFWAAAGTTYHIAVDGTRGASGPITLDLARGNPPPNDDFASARILTGLSSTDTLDNRDSTFQPGEPGLGLYNGAGVTLWWAWTAPTNGNVLVTTTGSEYDTRLAVFTGDSLSSLTLVTNNDDYTSETTTSRVLFNAFSGITYRIVVDGYLYGGVGLTTLNLNVIYPPSFLAAEELLSSGEFNLRIKGTPEQRYGVEYSPDLRAWHRFSTNTATSQPMVITDPGPMTSQRYYRAVELQ